jgi:SDR family mycofactocin-dependent oxidoreductase
LREEGKTSMAALDGKVALITGAARGQGRAEAVRLAADGANIIAVDLCDQIASVPYPMATPDDLAATVKLVEDAGARIIAQQADVRDQAALNAALQAGLDEFGRLDIVVANAGIAPMQSGADGWRDVIDVNLTGVHNTVEIAIPTVVEQGNGGSIVLISSAAGLVGIGGTDPGSIGYTAAKHGVVGLMRVYANHLAPHSIRVNSIHPTGVNTPMINNEFTRQWLAKVVEETGRPVDMGNALPVQLVEAEDIAAAVAWLVSDDARYITGVALPVDAGFVNKR